MAFQTVFKRYELKYIITREQKAKILSAMAPYMVLDKYGRSTIRNIYFDTDDFILARHSIEKPDFKEKLRIRSYSQATGTSTVFVELKRKYDHVVYKRRIPMPESAAMEWTQGLNGRKTTDLDPNLAQTPFCDKQMHREIDYFLSYYGDLHPAAFLSYEREAYKMISDGKDQHSYETAKYDKDFRVTFDENILFRDHDLSLRSEVYGDNVLDEDKILMELKCSGGIPLWMVDVLSEEQVYKTSFSKYGTAYKGFILTSLALSRDAAAITREHVQDHTADNREKVPFAAAAASRTLATDSKRSANPYVTGNSAPIAASLGLDASLGTRKKAFTLRHHRVRGMRTGSSLSA